MIGKIAGALLIVGGSGGIGFSMSQNHKREAAIRCDLIHAIDWMILELKYKMPPLETLFREAASVCQAPMRQVLEEFASELEQQVTADIALCMRAALKKSPTLSDAVQQMLINLTSNLGVLDLHSQISVLEGIVETCKKELEHFTRNQDVRLRNYPTLGLCIGAALVILLF